MKRLLEIMRQWQTRSLRNKVRRIVDMQNIDWEGISKFLVGPREVKPLGYREIKCYLGEKIKDIALAGILLAGYDLEASSQKAITQVRSGDFSGAASTIEHCAARFGLGLTSCCHSKKVESVLTQLDAHSFGGIVAKAISPLAAEIKNMEDTERAIEKIKTHVSKACAHLSDELSFLGGDSCLFDRLFRCGK